jgi:MIP family channel proteins
VRRSDADVQVRNREVAQLPLEDVRRHGRLSFRSDTPRRTSASVLRRPTLVLGFFRVREAFLQRGIAEFVGTFTLIFVGAGSIIATQGGNLTAIGLAHGLAIGVMASAVGHISGGHFNPAVTLGFVVTRRIEPRLAATYWFAQLIGAVLAAFMLTWLLPQTQVDAVNLGAPAVGNGIGAGSAVVIEGVLTFFLVWVIFATAADPRGTFASIAGLAIGLTITLDIYIGGVYTGAAMNPARAFGPDLVQNYWSDAWVWWVGPLIGGALAALLYEYLYLRPVSPEPVGPPETGLEEPRPGDAAAM